jgi:hypothetical protein
VEHSIMKRAWPYAVALAIVVTGCYLALTPLLRSLSPGASPSSSSLTHVQTSATVGQSKIVTFPSQQTDKVPSQFASDLPNTVKKAKKKADTPPTDTTPQAPTDTTGFAGGSSSTQTPPKTAVKAKTKPVKKGSGSVTGSVDPGNGGGLASPGGNGTQSGGTHSDPAGN